MNSCIDMKKFNGGLTVDEFTQNMKPGQVALELLNEIPDIGFWIKDRDGRFVFLNHAYYEAFSRGAEIGMTDEDIHTPELAKVYRADEKKIVETGESIRHKMELVTMRTGAIEWRSTTKIPIYDRDDKIMGTAGISRKIDQVHPLPSDYRAIGQLVEYIHQNVGESLSVSSLAAHSGMSISTLERRFHKHLGTTPRGFIQQARIAAACDLLANSQLNIGEISLQTGFQEHASFTRSFERIMHMTPSVYRRYYRSSD